MTTAKFLKTVTIKEMGLVIPKGGEGFLDKRVAVFNCSINGYFLKMTNYGESVALTGDINAANLLDGTVYEGTCVYMPADFAATVQKKLDANPDSNVDFQAEVVVVGSEKSARGYTFITRPISTLETINKRAQKLEAFQSLLASLPESKQLEAPKKAASK